MPHKDRQKMLEYNRQYYKNNIEKERLRKRKWYKENVEKSRLKCKKYREENATNPMFGHCYHSSQALFYLMDTDVLEQRTAIDYHYCSHWWVVDTTTDKVYDITADQYYCVGQIPPYIDGKKKPWYGWKQRPHQRTLDLMVLVLGDRLAFDKITDHLYNLNVLMLLNE